MRKFNVLILFAFLIFLVSSCRRQSSDVVTVALPEAFSTFDTLTSEKSDAAAERVKSLMFNGLVKKDENFDYVGDLAENIATSDDGQTITFTLRSGVKFHNGKEFSSADVKYTFDELFRSKGFKSFAFYDPAPPAKQGAVKAAPTAHIESITTPDARTVVFRISRPALRTQLLANLVAIPIIAEGTSADQKSSPVGTGPFKFTSLDASQSVVELSANQEYFEGSPKIARLQLKTITDANSLLAELATGRVDMAPNPNNISADTIKSFDSSPNLNVVKSDGSNIQYLVFNTEQPPLNNVKVRQAIAYAIDRERIVRELLFDQARLADSVLPLRSFAYSPGTVYRHDAARAKQLLNESGYKNEPINFKYGSGNVAVNQYAQVLQSSLTDIGLNVQIETLDRITALQQVALGQYGMFTGVFVGGNQDPIYLRDLFTSAKIPTPAAAGFNRSRYVNAEVDKIVADAINATDKERAKELYVRTWEIVSSDMPLLPLWYPSNLIVVNKRIGNVKINPSGDWSFIKDITVTN